MCNCLADFSFFFYSLGCGINLLDSSQQQGDKGNRKRYLPSDKDRPGSPLSKRMALSPDRGEKCADTHQWHVFSVLAVYSGRRLFFFLLNIDLWGRSRGGKRINVCVGVSEPARRKNGTGLCCFVSMLRVQPSTERFKEQLTTLSVNN